METDLLVPDPDEVEAPFYEHCAAGELRVQRCGSCGQHRFPPRPMCPACRSFDVEWEPMSGRARLWSYVVSHPPTLPAYAEFAPYPVVVVELADDPSVRMVGNVVAGEGAAINSVPPEELEIGMELEVTFAAFGDRMAVPRWVPVD